MNVPATDDLAVLRKERFIVIILAAIQVAHILDFVIMMPLGPQFMRVFNISPVEFSTLVSAYTFSAGIVGFFGALYADHFDRKKFLLFNFSGFIIGTFMCAISPNFGALLAARIIAGAFGGVLNASVLSLVSDLIPYQRRGAAMGVVMSAFSISSILGVPTGLFIANAFDWHGAFYFICIVGLIFWIAAYFVLPSVKIKTEPRSFKSNLMNFKSILIQKDYIQAFTLTSTLGFGIFMIVPFISTYIVRNVGMPEDKLPLIYLVGGIGTIITARIVGKLCDKIGSYAVFRVTAVISIVPILLLTNLPAAPLWIALIVTSLFTMFGSARFIPAMTLVSAVVKPEERGTFMSLENASRQLSSGLASQGAGLILGSTAAGALTHYNVVGLVGVVTSIVAIFIALRIKNKFNLR
ncbi:MFS transporter [Peredibacter sp. HCB2-198]|uniref:MFS transporter n=1 Tax=Peredibacter sp. HCB2-198 TaxID=3383025 RepID=UPI0038B5AEE6